MKTRITEGTYSCLAGTLRYWDIEFVDDDEDHLSRYISGQVPFIEEPVVCRRCYREIKRRYTFCYRCYRYLEKKVS